MIINVDPTNRKLGLSVKALERGAQEVVAKKAKRVEGGPVEGSAADVAAYRDRGSLGVSIGEALKASAPEETKPETEAPAGDIPEETEPEG